MRDPKSNERNYAEFHKRFAHDFRGDLAIYLDLALKQGGPVLEVVLSGGVIGARNRTLLTPQVSVEDVVSHRGLQPDEGSLARTRPSHQPTPKPTRYMMPYQWIFNGPICSATGLMSG